MNILKELENLFFSKAFQTLESHFPSYQLFCCNRDCQLFTPLRPSPLYNQTTVFSRHTDKKAMGPFAGYITRLKCSFHIPSTPVQSFFRIFANLFSNHISLILSSEFLYFQTINNLAKKSLLC
jgi:hypothetical protein